MLTQYSASIKAPVAYKPENLTNTLGEYLASLGKTQLRIAETEKYAHVTFFFSGGREELYAGEQRILIPSPQVATYDLQPEMSAFEVTDKLVAAINSGEFDVLICNYANGDMVGSYGCI
jgi:2,3-bisphosphoglycerate-independent phosphoglycerate mutase